MADWGAIDDVVSPAEAADWGYQRDEDEDNYDPWNEHHFLDGYWLRRFSAEYRAEAVLERRAQPRARGRNRNRRGTRPSRRRTRAPDESSSPTDDGPLAAAAFRGRA
jgi:hypothetical protein